VACAVSKKISQNISALKKDRPQVTEQLKVWRPRRKDMPARLCRTPAYKAS